MKSIFRNRKSQEKESTINRLRATPLCLNTKKEQKDDTPYNTFNLTIQPNTYVDEFTLENDFKYILCLYYRWMYGSKWHKLKHVQYAFNGVIEKQAGEHNHIHLTFNEDFSNYEELAIFVGFITEQLKIIYPKLTFRCERCYDLTKWNNYISPFESHKDKYKSKRREEAPMPISNILFQQHHFKN